MSEARGWLNSTHPDDSADLFVGYTWDFSILRGYESAFLWGACLTFALGVLSSAIGTLLAVPIALLLRGTPFISIPLGLLMDALRAIPNLVLILAVYYLPYRVLFATTGPSPFTASLAGLVIAQTAYSADLIRSAIGAVPSNQLLAVRGLGYREWQVVRWVSLPSVVRQVLPSHMALWIGNIKLSSLASTVGVPETVFVARVAMSQTYRSLEAWLVVAAIYVVLVTPLTLIQRRIENSAWLCRQ
jgi:His/Glu/Gln/Arg/opine family amino acid ABC transporter permease subunit